MTFGGVEITFRKAPNPFNGRTAQAVCNVSILSMAEEEHNEQAEPLDVYSIVAMMSDQLAMIAWQKLGLQPDMMTGRIDKDLEQAKVAIDLISQMSIFIESKLDESDKRRIQGLVRDLKLNYVEKRKENGDDA